MRPTNCETKGPDHPNHHPPLFELPAAQSWWIRRSWRFATELGRATQVPQNASRRFQRHSLLLVHAGSPLFKKCESLGISNPKSCKGIPAWWLTNWKNTWVIRNHQPKQWNRQNIRNHQLDSVRYCVHQLGESQPSTCLHPPPHVQTSPPKCCPSHLSKSHASDCPWCHSEWSSDDFRKAQCHLALESAKLGQLGESVGFMGNITS